MHWASLPPELGFFRILLLRITALGQLPDVIVLVAEVQRLGYEPPVRPELVRAGRIRDRPEGPACLGLGLPDIHQILQVPLQAGQHVRLRNIRFLDHPVLQLLEPLVQVLREGAELHGVVRLHVLADSVLDGCQSFLQLLVRATHPCSQGLLHGNDLRAQHFHLVAKALQLHLDVRILRCRVVPSGDGARYRGLLVVPLSHIRRQRRQHVPRRSFLLVPLPRLAQHVLHIHPESRHGQLLDDLLNLAHLRLGTIHDHAGKALLLEGVFVKQALKGDHELFLADLAAPSLVNQ
mmetsp:Transcript_24597/g.59692  ORF Transcript_24597/g.59692 Transcript_24597/m.59692 type:complete len:292 (-) Transcript_24597:733-1608(-)